MTKQVDDGEAMDVEYLDFSKALDKVPKMRLIEKIKSRRVDGRVLSWITNCGVKSYLEFPTSICNIP